MKQHVKILCTLLVMLLVFSVIGTQVSATVPDAGTPVVTVHPTSTTVTEFSSASFTVQALNVRQYVWEVVTPDGVSHPCTDLYDIFPGMEMSGCNSETLYMSNIPRGMDGCTFTCRIVGAEQSVYSYYAGLFVTALEEPEEPAAPPPVSTGTPVVTKNPGGETVTEGGSAVFIARADYTKQYVWEFAIGETLIDCSQLPSYWGNGVQVSGSDSEKLTISNIPLDLNDGYVRCRFVGAEESVYSDWARLGVTKDTKVAITEQPASKTITEGGSTYFSIKAQNATGYSWELIHPSGNSSIMAQNAPEYFPGLKISGHDTVKLTLDNVPVDLNGWLVRCIANSNTGSDASVSATINVSKDNKVVITEQPAGKAVVEGGSVYFSIKAQNATGYSWEMIHPSGNSSIMAQNAPEYFPGLKVSGYDSVKLVLENIPADLDGWLVRCVANGKTGAESSIGAELEVSLKPTETTEATDVTEATTEATEAEKNKPGKVGKDDKKSIDATKETEQVVTPTETVVDTTATSETGDGNNIKQQQLERMRKNEDNSNNTLIIIVVVVVIVFGAITAILIQKKKRKANTDKVN